MKNENAVSPIIGFILMVVITVILSAVIAYFVFHMAGIVTKEQNPDHITLFVKEKSFGDSVGFFVVSGNNDVFYVIPEEQRTVQAMEFYDCDVKYDYWIPGNSFLMGSSSGNPRITNCKINETVMHV